MSPGNYPPRYGSIYPSTDDSLDRPGIFDISGVMFGMGRLAKLTQPDETIPGSVWAFLASAIGSVVGGLTGSTPVIVQVETAAGINEGGRTGLTAVTIGALFLCSVFLAPLFGTVPQTATAPILVLVGAMMMGESKKIDWSNMSEAVPAYFTTVMMPFSYRSVSQSVSASHSASQSTNQPPTSSLSPPKRHAQHHQRHPLRHRHVPGLLLHHGGHGYRPRLRPPGRTAPRWRGREGRRGRGGRPDARVAHAALPLHGQPDDGAVRCVAFCRFVRCEWRVSLSKTVSFRTTNHDSRPSLLLSKGQVHTLDEEQEAEERALKGHFLPIAGDHRTLQQRAAVAAAGGAGAYGTVGGGIASSL